MTKTKHKQLATTITTYMAETDIKPNREPNQQYSPISVLEYLSRYTHVDIKRILDG